MSRLSIALAVSAIAFVQASASAQQDAPPTPPAPGQSWYYGPTTPTPNTKPLAQQKAELRAEQRMARLEVLRRYGLSPNRPPAVAVPFTSVSTLSWMRNGRSPFIYYRSDRPLVYYSYPYTVYR